MLGDNLLLSVSDHHFELFNWGGVSSFSTSS